MRSFVKGLMGVAVGFLALYTAYELGKEAGSEKQKIPAEEISEKVSEKKEEASEPEQEDDKSQPVSQLEVRKAKRGNPIKRMIGSVKTAANGWKLFKKAKNVDGGYDIRANIAGQDIQMTIRKRDVK